MTVIKEALGYSSPLRNHELIYFVCAVVVTPLMISNQSFWIDEGSTGLFARQPNLNAWWQYLRANVSSDSQMPLSLFLTWLYSYVAGTGEWQIRALNLLWAGLTLWSFALVGKRFGMPWLPLLAVLQPYFWFYTGEARGYALQIAAGSWILFAFVDFLQAKACGLRWAFVFTLASGALACATMLAPITILTVFAVAVFVTVRERWKVSAKSLLVLGAGAILVSPVGLYYADALGRGARGAQLWSADFKYLPYVSYELFGLTGLGPPVSELRELARSQSIAGLLHSHWGDFTPAFGCAVALGSLLFLGWRGLRSSSVCLVVPALLTAFFVGAALFFVSSLAAHKAFWARHLAPLFPFYVTLLGVLVARTLSERRSHLGWPALAVSAALLLVSSLNLRFSERHAKDDYRSASSMTLQALAAAKTVWWVAAPEAAEYYRVPLAYNEVKPGFALCAIPHTGIPSSQGRVIDFRGTPPPDLIVFSKPEISDPHGVVASYIATHRLQLVSRFKAFTLWVPPHPEL